MVFVEQVRRDQGNNNFLLVGQTTWTISSVDTQLYTTASVNVRIKTTTKTPGEMKERKTQGTNKHVVVVLFSLLCCVVMIFQVQSGDRIGFSHHPGTAGVVAYGSGSGDYMVSSCEGNTLFVFDVFVVVVVVVVVLFLRSAFVCGCGCVVCSLNSNNRDGEGEQCLGLENLLTLMKVGVVITLFMHIGDLMLLNERDWSD